MNSSLRLALIVTLATTAFTAWQESQLDNAITPPAQTAASASTPRSSAPVSSPADAATDGLGLRVDTDLTPAAPVDLFSHRPWLKTTPPPPPATPTCDSKRRNKKSCAPAAEQVAPALPFGFAGIWVEGPVRYVVLSAGNEQFLLCNQCSTQGATRVGGTVLGHYRLDSLDSSQAVFTYLPLMQRQSLTLESL
jgi:hypothetical protein